MRCPEQGQASGQSLTETVPFACSLCALPRSKELVWEDRRKEATSPEMCPEIPRRIYLQPQWWGVKASLKAVPASTFRKTCLQLCSYKTKKTWPPSRLCKFSRIPEFDWNIPRSPAQAAPMPDSNRLLEKRKDCHFPEGCACRGRPLPGKASPLLLADLHRAIVGAHVRMKPLRSRAHTRSNLSSETRGGMAESEQSPRPWGFYR